MTRDANLLTLGLLALALLAAPGPAASYVWNTCDGGSDWILWEADEGAACDGCAPMLISTVSFPPGSAGESEIILAMDSWNDIERSTANFTWSPGTDGEHAVDNGENEIYYDGIDGVGNTLAVTRLVYNGLGGNCLWLDDANISEADVEFDTVEAWYTSAFSYTSSSIHLQTVANHEFGHALGRC